MASLLRSIFEFLNRDITGKTWERRQLHPYFGEAIYFGSKDPSQCYWEAELALPSEETKIGITMQGATAGPTASEEQFCRMTLSDLDGLFGRCRLAFQPVFETWAKGAFPNDWHHVFVLDGLSVPINGDENMPWHVCYFVEPAGHYFTAYFENGRVKNVTVDG